MFLTTQHENLIFGCIEWKNNKVPYKADYTIVIMSNKVENMK